MISVFDIECLNEALFIAKRGIGSTRPNPPVGAVIAKGGDIIGKGWHKKAGEDHAEVAAIKNAVDFGHSVKGATLYVTLEPCSTPGRVGACTDAIIEAGISNVIYILPDPNPKNCGRARVALAKGGVKCEQCKDEELIDNAKTILMPFKKYIKTGLPFVSVKVAMSLDGQICDLNGDAKWISSARSRKTTMRLRKIADAIIVGAETIRKDNPSLLYHKVEIDKSEADSEDYYLNYNDDEEMECKLGNPNLIRVVVSKSGNLPKDAQVFTDGKNQTLVFDDAVTAIKKLGEMGCLHVVCEGGLKLARSLADAGLVDEWMTVLAPIVIGNRPISEAQRFEGNDYVYWANPKSRKC